MDRRGWFIAGGLALAALLLAGVRYRGDLAAALPGGGPVPVPPIVGGGLPDHHFFAPLPNRPLTAAEELARGLRPL